jgi:hypothetical protein
MQGSAAMNDDPGHNLRGAAMTADILAAAAPIVEGEPTGLVIEVMCAVAFAAVVGGCEKPSDQGLVLRRFAARLNAIADALR